MSHKREYSQAAEERAPSKAKVARGKIARAPRATREAARRREEFRASGLYRQLCYLFRRDRTLPRARCKGPLKLSQEHFEAAQQEFAGHEIAAFANRIGEAQQHARRAPVAWEDVDWAVLGRRIEGLRLRMHFALTAEVYKEAERELNAIVRDLKPKRRKEHQIKRDALGFVRELAERHFLWIILKGDHRAGLNPKALQKQYSYCPEVPWETIGERLGKDIPPQRNAQEDMTRRYNLAAESIPVLLSPSHWIKD